MKELHITTDLIDVKSQAAGYFINFILTIKIIVTCFEQQGSIVRYLKLMRIIAFTCKFHPLRSSADTLNHKRL